MTSAPRSAESQEAAPAAGAGSGLTRLTVNLTPRAVAALDKASVSAGVSKTDVVNRAIWAYQFITGFMADGGEVVLRSDGKKDQVLVFV